MGHCRSCKRVATCAQTAHGWDQCLPMGNPWFSRGQRANRSLVMLQQSMGNQFPWTSVNWKLLFWFLPSRTHSWGPVIRVDADSLFVVSLLPRPVSAEIGSSGLCVCWCLLLGSTHEDLWSERNHADYITFESGLVMRVNIVNNWLIWLWFRIPFCQFEFE